MAAKRATYALAGEGGELRRTEDGARILTYAAGGWSYQDEYHGSTPFVGEELVRSSTELCWAMVYFGRVIDPLIDAGSVYEFLKRALRQVDAAAPFRGPRTFPHDEWSYVCAWEGDVSRFTGTETIACAGVQVYELSFTGGFLNGVD